MRNSEKLTNLCQFWKNQEQEKLLKKKKSKRRIREILNSTKIKSYYWKKSTNLKKEKFPFPKQKKKTIKN